MSEKLILPEIRDEVVRSFDELFFITVTPFDRISDLALDSLDFLSLVQLLEQKFEISIPDRIFAKEITVSDLVSLVSRKLDQKQV